MSLRRLYLGKSPARPNENESALDYLDHTDEGYVEQRFEPPEFMLSWSDEQKAEFAYQLLLTIPTSRTLKVVDRLTPLLHRDVISLLPYELALHILSYVDALTLTRVSHVSRKWRTFSEDQTLWRALFLDQGWHFDQKAMDDYLNNTPSSQRRSMLDRATPEDVLTDDTSVRPRFSPVPLSRSTVNVYDPSDLSAISSPSGRLRPFKRTSDLLLRLRQRRTLHHYSLRGQGLEPSTSCSLPSDPAPSFSASYIPHNLDVSETDSRNIVDAESYTLVGSASSSSSSSQSNVARRIATLQPIPFPLPLSLAAPTSHSRSQPIYSHRRQLSPSSSSSPSRVVDPSTIRNSVSSNSRLLPSITSSDLSTTRLFKNRPTPRRHVKYDETALYHYNEATDDRFINWRRLYRNRFIIDKRWREGKCKMKTFPPNNNALTDIHLEGIYCIQFDDNKIISGSRDRTIKVWDMQTGECRRTLLGHTASVLCLQYDDRYIISGSSDANIIQWDVDTGEIIRTLYGHDKSVLNLRFRGNRIVSCSKDCTLRIWDLESGTTIRILRGHRAAVNAVQFTDDRIVSASGDRTIKLWDMETGVCLRTFDSHSRGIACVEFDGKRIVSGSSDQTIKVWNPETGECLHTLVGHTDLVRTLQLDAEADRIISGSYDGSLKIWSLSQGCLVRSLGQAIEGRVLNLQFDYARIVCCTNLAKIVKYDFAYGIDTQFLK